MKKPREQKSTNTKKEWKDYSRKEKHDVYAVFATIGIFLLSWIATGFLSAIIMVLFGYFLYFAVNAFRHSAYRKKNGIAAAAFFVLVGITAPLAPTADTQNTTDAAPAVQIKAQDDRKKAEREKLREIEATKPVVKTEIKVESVPFEAIEQNDNTLPAGQKMPSVVGVNGERTITYSVTYVNGAETTRSETENEITKAPVTQVTLNGTYVKSAPVPAPASQSSGGVTKLSRTGICHAPGTTYYNQTKNFTSYNTLQDCLNAGGRMPKR